MPRISYALNELRSPENDVFVLVYSALRLLTAYGHFGPKAVRTRDTSAPVQKCPRKLRHLDSSVLMTLVPKCSATAPTGEHCRDSALTKDFTHTSQATQVLALFAMHGSCSI